jgi:hypothetical protein
MNLDELFDEALGAEQPFSALYSLLQALVAQGWKRETLLVRLECYRNSLQRTGKDQEENIALDAMDCLAGWCSPQMKI